MKRKTESDLGKGISYVSPPDESHRPKSPRDDGGFYFWISKRAVERIQADKDTKDKHKPILALVALAKIASDEGGSPRFSCSQEHIGQQVGRTSKTIRQGLHDLARLGIIHIQPVIRDEKRMESIYTLLAAKTYRKPRANSSAGSNGKSRKRYSSAHNKETSLSKGKRDVSEKKKGNSGFPASASAPFAGASGADAAEESGGLDYDGYVQPDFGEGFE